MLIEEARINGETLKARDGLESVETTLEIFTDTGAHMLVIEMATG